MTLVASACRAARSSAPARVRGQRGHRPTETPNGNERVGGRSGVGDQVGQDCNLRR